MHDLFHLFHILPTVLANLGLRAADLKMLVQLVKLYKLRTKFTFLGFVLTAGFVLTKKALHGCKLTELALDLRMFRLLVVILVGLRDALATGGALVVLPRTAHFVHAKPRDIDLLGAYLAQFCVLWLCIHN